MARSWLLIESTQCWTQRVRGLGGIGHYELELIDSASDKRVEIMKMKCLLLSLAHTGTGPVDRDDKA